MSEFDYIITGAGAAGLSLVYHLGQSSLSEQRVLLVDLDAKTSNDRTWCFWEAGESMFEPVVYRSWERLWFHAEEQSDRLHIAPYRYKMIRGIDFYRFVQSWIDSRPNITRVHGSVEQIRERPDGAEVVVNGQVFRGRYVFNSIYQPGPRSSAYSYWLQHFKGWEIKTSTPVFDPHAATFMDFRIEQKPGDVRFVYVLPYDEYTALVEYTLFSADLVAQEIYERGLTSYISEYLGISDYTVQHVEFGVIPMTDTPFPLRPSPHVLNIGTAGGMTKASTGYTFQRIQKHSRQIVERLVETGQPFGGNPLVNRHALMDSVLLNVLDNGREHGWIFFSQLFGRNNVQHVLRFLDEESSLLEDLVLITTVNIPAFIEATIDVFSRRMRSSLANQLLWWR